jgi:hypothetical protein
MCTFEVARIGRVEPLTRGELGHDSEAFVGIDTSKLKNAVAIAEAAAAARCAIGARSTVGRWRHAS